MAWFCKLISWCCNYILSEKLQAEVPVGSGDFDAPHRSRMGRFCEVNSGMASIYDC